MCTYSSYTSSLSIDHCKRCVKFEFNDKSVLSGDSQSALASLLSLTNNVMGIWACLILNQPYELVFGENI